MSTPLGRSERGNAEAAAALQAVLAAEHAAIFGYGAVGPYLPGGSSVTAAAAETAHRDARDTVATLLTAMKASPVPAERAYVLPLPVTNTSDALSVATTLEERTAAAWRAAVPAVTGSVRATAVGALTGAAVRAARWRIARSPGTPATVPFPGV